MITKYERLPFIRSILEIIFCLFILVLITLVISFEDFIDNPNDEVIVSDQAMEAINNLP